MGGDDHPRIPDVSSLTLQPDARLRSEDGHNVEPVLCIAVTHPNASIELIRVLISAGADVNAVRR